jgi:tRNA-dihydrouridine synthase C
MRDILILAPMEGISDALVRDLLSSLGGMDLCVTEFIRVAHQPLKAETILRECPELKHGGVTPSGTPVLVQLLGGEPEHVAESAHIAAELGAPGIDLNFGCPAKKVNGSDGGAALLKSPHRLTDVIGAVRARVPRHVSVSAKMRLGWENPDDVVTLAQAAEAGGAEWITIHGRTREQRYAPPADWSRIALAKEAVKVPVVANGDLFTPAELARCKAITKTHAFMLGRGAFRTPNLFRWMRGMDQGPWSFGQCAAFIERFVEAVLACPRYDEPERAALNRTKGFLSAMAEASNEAAEVFEVLKRTTKLADALQVLRCSRPKTSAA